MEALPRKRLPLHHATTAVGVRYGLYRKGGAVPDIDQVMEALQEVERGAGTSKATSIRLPESLHRAVSLATELGMDDSFTAATTHALVDRLRGFVRQRALAAHIVRFPSDRPTLAAVAKRRVSGTDHPADRRPDLVAVAAEHVERRRPDWLSAGEVDAAVDLVLDHVEMLAAGSDLDDPVSTT